MGKPHLEHRPLQSGIQIASTARGAEGAARQFHHFGTLTGVATRISDNKKVLVTNLHVVGDIAYQVNGTEEIFQQDFPESDWTGFAPTESKKIGTIIDHIPVRFGNDILNVADVAVFDIAEGVAADFHLHDSPTHGSRVIRAGTHSPGIGDTLTLLGSEGGECTVTVVDVNTQRRLSSGFQFSGLTILDITNCPDVGPGDSGAPLLFQEESGDYKMSVILMGGDKAQNRAWGFPASVLFHQKGIYFGLNRPPVANAGAHQNVLPGTTTVNLDGSGSRDEDIGDNLS